MDELTFRSKLWQRSENSAATTVPRPIRAAQGVPADGDYEVVWQITETGEVIVEFEQVDEAGDTEDE